MFVPVVFEKVGQHFLKTPLMLYLLRVLDMATIVFASIRVNQKVHIGEIVKRKEKENNARFPILKSILNSSYFNLCMYQPIF